MARAMARDKAMARTTDRPRLGLGLWLALGLGLGLGSVFTFKRPDRFCRRTKFNVTGHCWWSGQRYSWGGIIGGIIRLGSIC